MDDIKNEVEQIFFKVRLQIRLLFRGVIPLHMGKNFSQNSLKNG